METSQWVWLARIRRPQGRKGEVFAEILTDFPEKFAQRTHLWLLTPEHASGQPGPPTPHASGQPGPPTPHASGQPGPPIPHASGQPGPPIPHASGHDFSRAEKPQKAAGALAPAPPREAQLTHHWLHKDGIVLHFAGIDSISAAETLAGLTVAIPRSERAPLPEGEVHIADLIGCTLVDVAGPQPIPLGPIENVDRTAGAAPLLIVRGPQGELLIPFAQPWLRKLDLAAQRVEMALPAGLTDL